MRAILTYHSIDDSGSPISVSPRAFRRHVEFLASGRVRVVPLAEVHSSTGEHVVAITFDDGVANFATEAWPLLEAHGLPATMFVVTSRVGTDNSWGGYADPRVPTLKLLDWDRLGDMAAQGLELGAHSRTHPHLDRLSESALLDEVQGSAEDLERRGGVRPSSFCYPYGSLNHAAHEAVARGYRRACTTVLAALDGRESPHRLPRLDAFYLRGPGRLEAFGDLRFRAHLGVLKTARGLRAKLSHRFFPPAGPKA